MQKITYRILADLIFILHVGVVIVIVIGWYYPALQNFNLIVTLIVLVSEIYFGYCPLTKWEFVLRKKLEPNLNYDSGFISYYVYKIFGLNIPSNKVKYPAIIILVFVLILNLLFR